MASCCCSASPSSPVAGGSPPTTTDLRKAVVRSMAPIQTGEMESPSKKEASGRVDRASSVSWRRSEQRSASLSLGKKKRFYIIISPD